MKAKQSKYTIADLLKDFPTDDACIAYIFAMRFPDPICPECKAEIGDKINGICYVWSHKCRK